MNTESKKWYKQWWAIILMSIALIFLIYGVTFLSYYFIFWQKLKSGEMPLPEELLGDNVQYEATSDKAYFLGAQKPQLTIVQFSDFTCSICKETFPTMRMIGEEYKDSVKIMHRDFPLSENSLYFALAAQCAGEQGYFWQMHDKMFQEQGNFEPEQLNVLARQIGLDSIKFLKCMEEEKYLDNIRQDFSDAERLGVQGTPTWFIDGHRAAGNIPYETLKQIIENLLEEKNVE